MTLVLLLIMDNLVYLCYNDTGTATYGRSGLSVIMTLALLLMDGLVY